jgi:pectinesterase
MTFVRKLISMKTIQINPSMNIQDTLLSITTPGPLTFILEPGIYKQKLRITRDDVCIQGSLHLESVIEWDDSANQIHADGLLFNTFRTPTVTILSNRVCLKNVVIRNTAGIGSDVGQAVAISLYGDEFIAIGCSFEARQDTIFLGPLPVDLTKRYLGFLHSEELHTRPLHQTFIDCDIWGDVDFIFGSGQAIFVDSRIHVLSNGYICAPSTYEGMPYGIVLVDCLIESLDPLAKPYLARPWREHGATLFYRCEFVGNFHENRFHDWEKQSHILLEEPYVPSTLGIRPSKELQLFIEQTVANIRSKF